MLKFLGGSSGGSSSKLLSEALFTVTKLEEEVRESLLDNILFCFEGEQFDGFADLKSSVEAEPLEVGSFLKETDVDE